MIRMTLAIGSLALAFAAPAVAQDAMMAAPMSKADTALKAKCAKLTPAAMAKNAKCAAFMKKHPDAMMSADGGMMSSDDAMMAKKKGH